ncbi:DeoR/GlpR transcriptional regulator [Nanchangia anserum]|uniref:Lactose phosphotransferase system repressor n=1 Tax=Nanchangia anserum TaxID=2692125 RepID=A0A8I0KNI6_9ACTO|nr:DeoR/GlpR family DNA-binding transcription regulator [Nanchangia anserum]MBD3689316.1 DeoR/GlpR transcriptional regulator [Nanchangia anserum]QOX81530.1 DeoR/GlpR transcriptional regulator [Nanchangia anserum]
MAPARNQVGAHARRAAMLEMIREAGQCAAADLAEHFGVSGETVRRDLRALERGGQIERSYGSARALAPSTWESRLAAREALDGEQKHRIAARAAEFIDDATTIFIDEGHLPSLILDHLPGRPLTIVTSSLLSALKAASIPHVTCLQLGGRVRSVTMGVVDHFGVEMLSGLSIDLAFIGANGIDENGWMSTPDPAVAAMKKQAIACSRRSVFVGTHAKFAQTSFVRFAHLAQMQAAVTGSELSAFKVRQLARHEVPIIRA